MKKIKRLAAIVAAVVMAGSLAAFTACDKKDDTSDDNVITDDTGNDSSAEADWEKLFDDTYALDNFTAETSFTTTFGMKMNGEALEEPEVFAEIITDKYDFEKGVTERLPDNRESGKSCYAKVDGKEISEYVYMYSGSDEPGYYSKEVYKGYASEEDAAAAFRQANLYGDDNDTFYWYRDAVFKGTGEKASVKGNLVELRELFDYDETTSTYTAQVISDELGSLTGMTLNCDVKVGDGVITYLKIEEHLDDMSYAQFDEIINGRSYTDDEKEVIDEEYAGVTVDFKYEITVELTDIGETEITIPADIEMLVESSGTNEVLITQAQWDEVFEKFYDKTIHFYYTERESGEKIGNVATLKSTDYDVRVNSDFTELRLEITESVDRAEDYSTITSTTTYEYYRMKNGALEKFTGTKAENSSQIVWEAAPAPASSVTIQSLLPEKVLKFYTGYKAKGETELKTIDKMFDIKLFSDYESYIIALDESENYESVTVRFGYGGLYDDSFYIWELYFTPDDQTQMEFRVDLGVVAFPEV